MQSKNICILANSVKMGERCIAGKEVSKLSNGKWQLSNNWFRPISKRPSAGINFRESLLSPKSVQPVLLDIIEIPFTTQASIPGQPEDWFFDDNIPWRHHGHFNKKVLANIFDRPNDIWLERGASFDRVTPAYLAANFFPSLYLVRPESFRIEIDQFTDSDGNTKKKRRGVFKYNKIEYNLALTDPIMEQRYFPSFPNVDVGALSHGPQSVEAICVSLAPQFNGFHYKIVAAVFE